MMDLKLIDKNWTLFLDRDGVINHEKPGTYVLDWKEFIFYPGVVEAMKILNERFGVIVMVTNQKGVGKNLMTLENLHSIHSNMLAEIEAGSGRIDNIYFCSDLEDDSPNRKPNPGMAYQAMKDFPQIDPAKSMIVGNKLSDMQFGRNAGLHTVFAATTNPDTPFPNPLIDLRFDSLADFATALTKA